MTAADLAALEKRMLAGGCIYVIGNADGRFELLSEFEPGAVDAEIMIVRDEGLEAFDAVAWEHDKPSRWWTLRDVVTGVGEHEISKAFWEERPARMIETPADYLACRCEACCIIDWSADINAIIGLAPAIECATSRLERRLRQALVRQALPKIRITTSEVRASVTRRAAA